jgi:hypothetical protein
VKWDKIDKEQYRILLEENMKDIAQIVQTKDDKPQNIDNIITEFSNIVVSFGSCQSTLGRAKFFLLFSHIFVICTFPIVYVTY